MRRKRGTFEWLLNNYNIRLVGFVAKHMYYIDIGKATKRKRGTFEWLLNKRTGLSSLRKFKFKFSVLCIFAGSSQKKSFSPKDIKNVLLEKYSN